MNATMADKAALATMVFKAEYKGIAFQAVDMLKQGTIAFVEFEE